MKKPSEIGAALNSRWQAIRRHGLTWAKRKVRKLAPMHAPRHSSGLDATHLTPEHDSLNRYRIAEEVLRLLTDQPADWSARLGLLGEWGSGKTVIANWVAKLASDRGHCVVWFNPWSATSVGQMWFELSQALHEELQKRGIELSTGRELSQLARGLYYGYGAASQTPGVKDYAGLIERFLRLTDEDIIAIRNALGSNRILVIVDDIDRADSTLIPKLLLAMRELFELPRFSFLIPFDKSKVVRALELPPHNLAGHDFLEKILDYQIQVPPPTIEQRLALFASAIRSVLPMMPEGVERELADVLPENPRKIKRIALQLQIAKQQIERHSADEIDWQSLLYAALLRSESDVFFEKYVRDSFFGDRRVHEAFSDSAEARAKARDTRIDEAIKDCVPDQTAHERLRLLAKAWDSKRGYWSNSQIAYTVQLFDRPHAFTWREFDDVLDLWKERRDASVILHKLEEAVASKRIPTDNVFLEFIDSMTGRYHSLLEKASSIFRSDQQADLIEQAAAVLSLAQAIGVDPTLNDHHRAHLFEKLAGAISPWAHFSGNAADARLRAEEEAVLLALAQHAGQEWARYAAVLEPRDPDMQSISSFNKVKERLLPLFGDRELALLEGAFTRDRGLRELLDYDALAGPRALFADPTSPAWTPIDSAPIPVILRSAEDSPLIQQNAHWFLRIVHADDLSGLGLRHEQVKTLLRADGIAALIWTAAIATPIQYRLLMETRKIHKMLCDLGVEQATLPIPDWLNAGRRENE